ncbi:hypothetical protein RB195_016332 [Necator americanus]|uniref:Uncharacterized protein n=1 Tax=Necator americanus TaxID=51031 RepID=A0ABR1E8N2_NECAM
MDERPAKIASSVAVTATIVGVGAAAAYIYSKHFRSIRRQNEHVRHAIEVLGSEIHALRKEIMELKKQENGVIPRTPSRNRGRLRNLEKGGAGDGSSTSQKCNQIYGRISSYQSLTSDTDYADAEEEWESEVVFSSPSKQPAVPLPSMVSI